MATIAAMRQAGIKDAPWELATYSVVLFKRTRNPKDEGNIQAHLKATLDGIQDAGLVANDRYLKFASAAEEVDKENQRVEITITRKPLGDCNGTDKKAAARTPKDLPQD